MLSNYLIRAYYIFVIIIIRLRLVNPRRLVLNYHQIDSPEFEEHVKILEDEGFSIVDLKSLYEIKRKENHKIATITFDDGYQSIYTNLIGIIKQKKLPITVYICTRVTFFLIGSCHSTF